MSCAQWLAAWALRQMAPKGAGFKCCNYCGCELDLGILEWRVLPERQLGFSCLSIRHGGDVCNCPAYGVRGCSEARFSMRWCAAMVPVDLLLGRDASMSHEDWVWLQRQCRVRSEWELGPCVSWNPREQVFQCGNY